MGFNPDYSRDGPTRAEVDASSGPVVLEFGNSWCGHCRAAEPMIREAFERPGCAHHIKVADASSKRLGRSFGVKLWPTLIFLKDGTEVARLVRPRDIGELRKAFDAIDDGS